MRAIDLRSDTVTQPTPAMREAIAKAPVGDDVYGEDPDRRRAPAQRAAQLLGKEAALFVPSGSMGNQASLRTLTRPGDVVLASENAHLLRYEAGAPAALWGVHVKTIGRDGLFDARDVRQAVVPSQDSHVAPTRVLAFENTHNFAGGRIFPLDALRDAAAAARELGLALHLDGARLFNAVVATGVPAAAWAEPFDTVSFCLSKGLGAPVGSLVCGSRAQIREVHRARKLLGGGMRQAGILAAAGLYALDHHIERLAVDHANAKRLRRGARSARHRGAPRARDEHGDVRGGRRGRVRARRSRDRALRINPIAPGRFRAVTHLDVTRGGHRRSARADRGDPPRSSFFVGRESRRIPLGRRLDGGMPRSAAHPPDELPSRSLRCTIWSSAPRKRERSFAEIGAGPRVISPASRRDASRSRIASAPPIESASNSRPLVPSARAPSARQRAASGTSAVITTSPGLTFRAIQSSAASGSRPTTTSSMPMPWGTCIGAFATSTTGMP